jgi:hypothetical protein
LVMVENNIVGVCCMSKNSPYFDNIFVQDHFSSTYFLLLEIVIGLIWDNPRRVAI